MSEQMDHDEWMEPEEDWGQERQAAAGTVRIMIEGPASERPTLEALASLLLGSATEGGEQFARRLKQWQAGTDHSGNQIYSESPDETDRERIRYALIGLVAAAPGAAQKTFTTALEVSDSAYTLVSQALRPVTNSRIGRPLQRRYDRYAAHGATIVDRWIDAGRATEQRSRALARQAAFEGEDEVMTQVIGVMATKPEVRDLITQQSVGMAEEVMDQLRARTYASDTKWENRIRRLLRRDQVQPQK